MSRGQDCAEILGIPTTDPRMLAIPLGSSGLWLRMVEAMRRMRSTTLRFGEHVPDGDELARAFSISRQELDDCLHPLERVGLLVREEDGALTSPLLVDQAERRRLALERREAARAALERAIETGEVPQDTNLRSVTAQINGRKGGRPRKDAKAAGQRNMPFFGAVPSAPGNPGENPTGFSAKPSEQNPTGFLTNRSEQKPDDAFGSAASRGLPDCSSKENQTGRQSDTRARAETRETQQARTHASKTQHAETQHAETQHAETQHAETHPLVSPAELDRIGKRMLALARLPATSWGNNSRDIVSSWLATGLTETELVVAAEEALRRRPRDVRTLGWFTPVFRQAADDRPPADPGEPLVTLTIDQERLYQAATRDWVTKVQARDFKAKRPQRADFAAVHAA